MKLQTAHKLFLLGLAITALGLSPILFPGAFNAGGQQQNFGVPGGASGQIQYNSSGSLAGASGLTTDGTSVGFSGNGTITNGPPFSSGVNLGWKFCTFSNSYCQGVASTGTEVHLLGTNGWFSIFGAGVALPANNANASTPDTNAVVSLGTNGSVIAKTYLSATNCSVNSVSPAACAAAAAGAFVVPTTTATYTVNSTAVKAASRIFLSPHTDARDLPSAPTCTAVASGFVGVSAIVAATSFTFALPSTTGHTCWDYWIVD